MARLMSRRAALLVLAGGLGKLASARAQPARPDRSSKPILIEAVRFFDGVADRLKPGHVLVADRKIQRISTGPITAPPGSTIIHGRDRVLIPGLTDAHWHMTLAASTPASLERADEGLLYASAVAEAHRTLQRGFTTVRDMAGPTFGLKDAMDAGVVPGPRVYPSGALISQTAGHGDFAPPHARPFTMGGRPSHLEELGGVAVVNGVPEVLAAVRQQLKNGASQIKLATGGGIISRFDPIDSLAFRAWERILGWARQHGAKVAFGTDLLFQPERTSQQNAMLTRFAKVYGSLGALRIATSGNCELFAASGPRNPYGEARLGVIQEGAWADLLLVEGDPTQDVAVLQDHERNLAVIIKDGRIFKNATAG